MLAGAYKGYTKDVELMEAAELFLKKHGHYPAEKPHDAGTIWLVGPIEKGEDDEESA